MVGEAQRTRAPIQRLADVVAGWFVPVVILVAVVTFAVRAIFGPEPRMESAAITLVKGDLRGLVRARRLSQATMKNIRQNLFFAFAYNVVGVPIAAGILYPLFGMLLSPIIASAAMTFSSVSVIGSALRLRNVKL